MNDSFPPVSCIDEYCSPSRVESSEYEIEVLVALSSVPVCTVVVKLSRILMERGYALLQTGLGETVHQHFFS
eukprot:jgi/Psemu1/301439/fgenesh1_kg.34_\